MADITKETRGVVLGDDDYTLVSGAIIGVSLIIVQVFISTGLSDIPEFISMFAFAVAIPTLGCMVYVRIVERRKVSRLLERAQNLYSDAPNQPRLRAQSDVITRQMMVFYPSSLTTISEITFFVGFLADVVGIIAAFWHLSWILGTVFLVTSLVISSIGFFYIVKITTYQREWTKRTQELKGDTR